MLIVSDALTALITMHYKAYFNRPRPTQVVPGLLSPIQHGGHSSFPSGHSTQAHVFAALLTEVIGEGKKRNDVETTLLFVSHDRSLATHFDEALSLAEISGGYESAEAISV